jgi:transcriptional regulator with XRE-family HTH domain
MANRRALGPEARRAARRTLAEVSDDLREARLRAGLTQQVVAARAQLVQAQISRIERGDYLAARVDDLGRHAAAVGLRLAIRAWPGGQPLRDQAQVALIGKLRGRCATSWGVGFEVTIPGSGDLRAWDMVLTGAGVRVGIEAVTRLRDVQALLRSVHAKQRDSGVDRVLIVVAATHANRRALGVAVANLPELAARTRSVLAALAAGRDPGHDAWILL